VIISEYVEGGSFNKAIEVYNGSAEAIDLASCSLTLYSNGSAAATETSPLATAGTLAPGSTFVACNTSTALPAALKDRCQGQLAAINFNGDDAVVLTCNDVVVDVFGQVGFDPGTAWGAAATELTWTADHTLRRKCGIAFGDPDGSNAFDPSAQWDGFAKDTFDGLGSHAIACP